MRWIGTGPASRTGWAACFRGCATDLVEFFFGEEDGLAKDSVETGDGDPDALSVSHVECVVEFA